MAGMIADRFCISRRICYTWATLCSGLFNMFYSSWIAKDRQLSLCGELSR